MLDKQKIIRNKYYSIRQTVKLMPFNMNCPSLQKLIDDDIKENNNRLFSAKIIKRYKQKRYYIRGDYIEEAIRKLREGYLIDNNMQK